MPVAKDLEEVFLDRFIEAVPAAIAALPDVGPVYCLSIAYDPGQFSTLPPFLGIGLKERWGQPDYEPWNPATMLQIDLPRTRFPELCRAGDFLDQRAISDGRLRSLLNEAARRLAGLEWARVISLTDDFIVYATDLELADLEGNLRRVLPKARFAELRRSGSLPT